MTETSEPKKRLNGMGAIGKAFQFVFSNLGHLFATSVVTLFVVALFQIAYTSVMIDDLVTFQTQALLSPDEVNADALFGSFNDLFFSADAIFMMIASLFVSLIFGGMFAIRWHRSALFGSDADNTGFGFEFSSSLWRYVGNTVMISLIWILILFISAVIFGLTMGVIGSVSIAGVLVVTGLVAALYVSSRLMISLPAAALGIPNFGLAEAWTHTKNHGWGILGSSIVMLLAVIALLVFVSIPQGFLGNLLIGPWTPPASDDAEVILAWQADIVVPWIWWDTLSSVPIYPITTGLITSFFSYIYLQIGKPPAWVEEQRDA